MAIDRTPLSLVKGEIDQTLYRAQNALESYAENPAAPYFLQTCAEYLHEVIGILGFVEVQGGVLLAQEIEQVVTALSNGKIAASVAEVAMRALLQLPDYLERIQGGARDLPIALLPLINELREARNESLLSEDLVFFPDFGALAELQTPQKKNNPAELAGSIKRARALFQSGLVTWLRNRDDHDALQRLAQAIEQLRAITVDPEVATLWWASAGLIETLLARESEIPPERALFGKLERHTLLSKIERNIKRLLDGGEAKLHESALTPLINQILYHIACSQTSGKIVTELRAKFHLEDALPNAEELAAIRDSMRGANRAVMTTVSAALREDLSGVMDAIDLFVRRRDSKLDTLEPVIERLRQISGTLTIIDQEAAQRELDYVADSLAQMVQTSPSKKEIEQTLIGLATRLVEVESLLASLGEQKSTTSEGSSQTFSMDDRHLQRAVFQQALASIAQAKDALTVFVRESALKEWGAAHASLSEVTGALMVLNLDRPRNLLDTCLKILNALSPSNTPLAPDQAKDLLDRLILAIAALEFYLEEQSHDRKGETFLAQGEAALAYLPNWEEESAPAPENISLFGDATTEEEPEEALILTPPTEALEQMFQNLGLTPAAESWERDAEKQISTMLSEPVAPEPSPPAETTQEENPFDSEMAAIFTEEAQDEMASIDANLPHLHAALAIPQQWRDQEQPLRTLRRSFHTLKGSGRMVGAARLGELAWAVENLLNKFLDGTIPLSAPLVHIVAEARLMVPGLVADFQAHKNTIAGVEELAEQAWRLAHAGHHLEEITLTSSSAPISAEIPPVGVEVPASIIEEITLSDIPAEEIAPSTQSLPSIPPLAQEISPAAPFDDLDWNLELTPPAQEVPPPPVSVSDPMLLELFTTETNGHLTTMSGAVAACREKGQCTIGDSLLRPLHTILGGARMTQLDAIATISYALEQALKARAAAQLPLDADILALLDEGIALITTWIAALYGTAAPPDHQPWLEQLAALPVVSPATAESPANQLVDLFLEAALDTIKNIEEQLSIWSQDPTALDPARSLTELFSSLASDAELADLLALQNLARNVSNFLERAVSDPTLRDPAVVQLISAVIERLWVMLEAVRDYQALPPADDLIAEFVSLMDSATSRSMTKNEPELRAPVPQEMPVAPEAAPPPKDCHSAQSNASSWNPPNGFCDFAQHDKKAEPVAPPASVPELNELTLMFLGEAEDLMASLEAQIRAATDAPAKIGEMRRTLHTIKGGARMIGVQTLADLTHALESMIIQVVDGKLVATPPLFDLLQAAADQIAAMLDQIRNAQPVPAALGIHRRIEQLIEGGAAPPAEPVTPPASVPELNELTLMFLGEAEDLMASLEAQIRAARAEPPKIGEMRRTLHTIKGGARMIGVQTLADLTHALESMIIQVVDGKLVATPPLFDLLQAAADQIAAMLDQIRNAQPVPAALGIHRRIEQISGTKTPAPAPPPPPPITEEKPAEKKEPEARAVAPPQEQIRVGADLLNKLINHAAEISITRSRVDQQISGFRHSLQEMAQTVARLREQWRKVEIETEVQIIHHHEAGFESGFDPLELDRYSNFNQLSRSLMESVSDLASLHGLLSGTTRDTEILLLQQARVTKELQEGLIRTRMVPFSGQIQRLQRIVRQTAQAVNIQAELKLLGGELELDRTVLDRMVAPLEHILRNSISHGIEPPADRRSAGKSETGIITITLKREAQEIVILASDDGRGLNLPAIRRKAIERGRLTPDAEIPDKELMQFILEPGVSTAKEVTQISGRGVGMDVVHNEVKLLGGTLEIDSEFGYGTTFTIRLPVTLAVAKVLLINVQGDLFAIPLVAIRAVLQLSYEELINLQSSAQPILTRAGVAYQFIHAAVMLDTPSPSYNLHPGEKLPVLLFSVGELNIALAVDRLLGAREIVVKSVGSQLGRVRGISGATILGDGRVVIILDMAALIRKSVALHSKLFSDGIGLMKKATRKAGLTVLVVDDSITVRKVTARLLERHQMKVFTARDGVDAVALMQKHIPDIVLMDIEMPRMDGYELAAYIRSEPRLREIPIVMITSRTGVKHRERARAIGVYHYLGKPYQETELLDTIHQLTRRIAAPLPSTSRPPITIN